MSYKFALQIVKVIWALLYFKTRKTATFNFTTIETPIKIQASKKKLTSVTFIWSNLINSRYCTRFFWSHFSKVLLEMETTLNRRRKISGNSYFYPCERNFFIKAQASSDFRIVQRIFCTIENYVLNLYRKLRYLKFLLIPWNSNLTYFQIFPRSINLSHFHFPYWYSSRLSLIWSIYLHDEFTYISDYAPVDRR